MQDRRPAYFAWFILPSVFLAVALVASLASLFQYSFREYIPGSIKVGDFTLANFGRMGSWVYLRVFIDSLLLSACTAAANLILGYPLAYSLVRSKSSLLKSTILITTIVPMFTGDIVRTYSWLVVLGKNGFINGTLKAAGIIDTPLELLYTPLGVTVALVQYSLPVMVIILAAAISHIDVAYEKAAASLGAGPLRVFWNVTLPLTMPGIISGIILVFIPCLGSFLTPDLLGGANALMIGNVIERQFKAANDWPFGAALSFLLMYATFGALALRYLFTLRSKGVDV